MKNSTEEFELDFESDVHNVLVIIVFCVFVGVVGVILRNPMARDLLRGLWFMFS